MTLERCVRCWSCKMAALRGTVVVLLSVFQLIGGIPGQDHNGIVYPYSQRADQKLKFVVGNTLSVSVGSIVNNEKENLSFPVKSSLLDKLVDLVLRVVRDWARVSNKDEIPLPDVDASFSTDVVFIPVKGRFRAQNGWFRNLSTIYRTGEAKESVKNNKIIVEFNLGLKTMEFGYGYYNAEVAGIQATGTVYGRIQADSIATKISLSFWKGKCRAHLESLKVTQLKGIQVSLTGWNGFKWLLTFIANCVSGSYRDEIIATIEKMLSQKIEEKLRLFSCKSFL